MAVAVFFKDPTGLKVYHVCWQSIREMIEKAADFGHNDAELFCNVVSTLTHGCHVKVYQRQTHFRVRRRNMRHRTGEARCGAPCGMRVQNWNSTSVDIMSGISRVVRPCKMTRSDTLFVRDDEGVQFPVNRFELTALYDDSRALETFHKYAGVAQVCRP